MTRFNLLLLAVLLASGVYGVRVSHEARRLFTALDRAQAEERRLDVERGRLQAERQTQATPLLVEKTARGRLGMHNTTPAITQYVPYPGEDNANAALPPQQVASQGNVALPPSLIAPASGRPRPSLGSKGDPR